MAKKERHIETPLLRGIDELCDFLGGLDKRVCRKHFIDKGLAPAYVIDSKTFYYKKSDVEAFLDKNYKAQSVKL